MNDKIMLGDFIYQLRKEKNMSQSELGQRVGVSNKAVSKWETYEANPDLGIILNLAEALGVTTDELLLCKKNDVKTDENNFYASIKTFIGIKGKVNRTSKAYEFISDKKTKKGLPYIHINVGKDEQGKIKRAKGIVAVGIISKGIVSAGIFSLGLFSVGFVSIGLVAMGAISLGLIIALGGVVLGVGVSIGGVAVGLLAVGGVAIGVLAVGGVSVGVLSVGGLSIGVWAHTGVFGKAIGKYLFFHK